MSTRTNALAASVAIGSLALSAQAAVDFGGPPEGFSVHETIAGTSASPANASRWFDDGDGAVRTNWANERITFHTSDLPTDTYMLGITAINGGSLPLNQNYSHFKVDVKVNGAMLQSNAEILASDTEWNTLWLALGEVSGEFDIELKWRNDNYRAGHYDANITFGGIQLAGTAVPAPGAAALAMCAIGVASRRRR
ncbi:MAG: hypothetical protein RLN60_04530 [Phycisphaerales bacterium]